MSLLEFSGPKVFLHAMICLVIFRPVIVFHEEYMDSPHQWKRKMHDKNSIYGCIRYDSCTAPRSKAHWTIANCVQNTIEAAFLWKMTFWWCVHHKLSIFCLFFYTSLTFRLNEMLFLSTIHHYNWNVWNGCSMKECKVCNENYKKKMKWFSSF